MTRFLVIAACFLFCSFSYGNKYEKIYSFHSDIQIQTDGSVLVTEKIEVLALGINIKKGIYRDIPLNFRLPDGVARQSLTVKSVKRDGKSEPYSTDMVEGGIRIYIGSANMNVSQGKHIYELTYELDRTVFCTEDVCKVMWNVNGNQWETGIDTLSATISTPENVNILSFDGWTGRQGVSDQKDFLTRSLGAGRQMFMTNKLDRGFNLTVSVAFNSDIMLEVPFNGKITYFFRDNSLYILAIFGFIVSFIINFILWFKHGKDPRKGTIIPQYYPPKDWSPAEVLFLLNDGKEDNNMFVAQLLQLAVKGHIKIEKKDTTDGEDLFVISYAEESSKKQDLTALEEGFVSRLLGTKPYTIIRDKYNHRVAVAQSYLVTEIEKNQAGLYFKKNRKLFFPQYILPVFTIIGMAIAFSYFEGPVWFIPLMGVLMIIMNVIFMRLFYQPTKEGRKMLDHILGLERFIKYADELRIKEMNKPDMNFDYFEQNLPYAVAFGKADKWGEKFKPQDIEPQYQSSNYYIHGSTFRSLAYIGALSAMSASASVAPSAAGSSGGGFSGGGFSGGGAGGGGGGGW